MVVALGAALHHHSTEFRFHSIEQQRGQFLTGDRTRAPEA
jgi:hypothetical protein